MPVSKIAIVTGCSSGIGKHVAILLAKNAYKVYATMRNTSKSQDLLNAASIAGVQPNKLVLAELDVTSD